MPMSCWQFFNAPQTFFRHSCGCCTARKAIFQRNVQHATPKTICRAENLFWSSNGSHSFVIARRQRRVYNLSDCIVLGFCGASVTGTRARYCWQVELLETAHVPWCDNSRELPSSTADSCGDSFIITLAAFPFRVSGWQPMEHSG